MRILVVHNHYGDYAFGGEGLSANTEAALLRSRGHEVCVYERTNAELSRRPLWERGRALWRIPWSPEGYAAIQTVIAQFKPDLMHVNNYRYLLSPSIFAAAKENGVATVCTLRNYQLVCPASQFLRKGRVCEDCLDGFPYRLLWRQCTGKGFVKNLCHLRLYLGVRKRGFLAEWVDAYIALTDFARDKFIQGGVPADKVHVKPNSMVDPLSAFGEAPDRGEYAIYVGRLSVEKGVDVLLKAWADIDYPLLIVGDGPLRGELEALSPRSVRFVGALPHDEVLRRIRCSAFMVFPSACYEGFPRTILEALACGKAVVASDLGPRREIVQDGRTGLLCEVGDARDLRQKILWLMQHPKECDRMGEHGRRLYLDRYAPDTNYQQLLAIYEKAMATSRQEVRSAP